MMGALRVEYLSNPAHGLLLTATTIAIYTGVLPDVMRLITTPIWGKLFDRMDFFILRIVLNCVFASSYLMFYTGTHTFGLITGALIYGLGASGGDVAWGLWVTKFAPAHMVAEYMGVHTFFTGLRGVVAPFVAFGLLQAFSVSTVAMISVGLIGIGSLSILPELRTRNARFATPPISEEILE